MKSLLPSTPPERLIESTGDGQESLRALRDRYIKKADNPKIAGNYYLDAAAHVGSLIDPIPVEAHIGQYHDYIATNQNEIVLDPTPEESERILRESAIELEVSNEDPS